MADQDPYGVDVRLTDTGDLAVTRAGDLTAISGPTNCVQAMTLRMRSVPGDLPLHPDYGNDLGSLVGGKSLDTGLIAGRANSLLRDALQSDRRFLAAKDITVAALDDTGQKVGVGLTLQLAGGEQISLLDLADVRLDEIDTVQIDSEGFESDDDLAFLDGLELDEIPDLEESIDDPAYEPYLDTEPI